jgi:hypothetical protein
MTLRRTQPLAVGHLTNPTVIANFIISLNHVRFHWKVVDHCAMSPLPTKRGAL